MRPKATIIAPEPHAIHRGISFSWIVWNLTVILGSLVSVSLSVKSVGMQRAPSRSFCSMAAHVRYCLGDHFPTRGFLSTCRLVSLSLSNSTNGLSFWTCILHPVSMLCPGITGHVDSSDSRCTSPGHVNSSDSSCTSPVHTCGWHVNSSYSFISSETYSPLWKWTTSNTHRCSLQESSSKQMRKQKGSSRSKVQRSTPGKNPYGKNKRKLFQIVYLEWLFEF